jgi:hypothetical protein
MSDSQMLRPKDRWAEIAAAAAAAMGIIGYLTTGSVALTLIAFIIGVAALAWSYLDVMR